jgi:hypothetical protein
MDLDLQVQLDADLQATVFVFGLALLIQVCSALERRTDLVWGEVLQLIIGHVGHFFELTAPSQWRLRRVIKEFSEELRISISLLQNVIFRVKTYKPMFVQD